MTRHHLLPCVLLMLAAACAQAEPAQVEPEADMSAAEEPPDMRQKPRQDMAHPPSDMRPPAPVDMALTMICAPGEAACLDASTLQVCAADGLSKQETPCAEGQRCEGSACEDPPRCTPGQATCLDASTLQVCRQSGQAFRVDLCPDETSCVDGACVSGALNGSACQEDDECAGGTCRCGVQDACEDAFATPAYCTTRCEDQSDCSDSEWCLSGQTHLISGVATSYDHCVPRCLGSCTTAAGLECKSVPVVATGGAIAWEQGCYFADVRQMGEPCGADVECVTGFCLRDYFSSGGVCSSRCEDQACPDEAACVANLSDGQAWCMLRCVDSPDGPNTLCPLDQPTDRLDVTCKRAPNGVFTCRSVD